MLLAIKLNGSLRAYDIVDDCGIESDLEMYFPQTYVPGDSERMGKLLEERGISAERLVPQQKDWNDDLKAEQENKMERSELCQTFC